MAKHDIDVKIPREVWVVNKDLEVVVRADGEIFGRLHISKGTIDWTPAHKKTPCRLGWQRFSDTMIQATEGHRRRRSR